MDAQRFQELARKRDGEGLSDEEANELGRLIAEREGKPYRNASDIHPDDPKPNGATAAEHEEATPPPPEEEMEQDREAGMEERGGQRYS